MAKSKIKVEKIEGVEESHINEAELESKEATEEIDTKPRVIKLRKYSLESTGGPRMSTPDGASIFTSGPQFPQKG